MSLINPPAVRIRANAWPGWAAAIAAVGVAGGLSVGRPAWVMMWAIAATEFFALKLATLGGAGIATPPSGRRVLAYLVAWPGMNARDFLRGRASGARPDANRGELGFALAKLALGLALVGWAVRHVATAPALLTGWIGMVGIIFTLHFGLFHVVSWSWRAAGFNAPPIMRAPIAATSLAEFWAARWNLAFADAARRFILRPLARRHGVRAAGLVAFLVSGLAHETVISLPARGGWGGPTIYFLLQASGLAAEKSALGLRCGLGHGVRGWLWTMLCTAVPLPLLFHAPFVHHVIVPLFEMLAALSLP